MKAEHLERIITGLQRRTPFRPFIVELISGSRIKVAHPEALVLRNGLAVYFSANGELTVFDHEGVAQVLDAKGKRAA